MIKLITKKLPNGLIIHIAGFEDLSLVLVGGAIARANEKTWELIDLQSQSKPFMRILEAGDPGFNELWDGELPVIEVR